MKTTTNLIVSLFITLVTLLPAWPIATYAANLNVNNTPPPADNNAIAPAQATPIPIVIPPAPEMNVKGYVLMDVNSGRIIAQKNAHMRLRPASLTKLMTLYITFQALKSGQIHLDDMVHISNQAWHTGGSRMFLNVGSNVPVAKLIQGIIVASGNDACVAIAQYIAGTQATFAQLMNQTATRLGMKETHYVDATGLPHPSHYATPYDLALLTRAIISNFPEYYHFFSQKWINYNHIKQPNRNRLLWRNDEVDGLKTGHTQEAGYCLITSAKRDDMRLLAVVMGAPTDSARANDSEALLNYGFRFYKTYKLFAANQVLDKRRIWFAEHKYSTFGLTKALYITIPIGEYKNLTALKTLENIKPPIFVGHIYGNVTIRLQDNQPIATAPLVALQNNKQAGMWSRLLDHILRIFN